ncbi:hypothetical protein YC2023_050428 [Brassica napus]
MFLLNGFPHHEIVGGAIDRKRINDALKMKLEKYSTSTSRGFSSKDKPQLPDEDFASLLVQ